MEEYPKKKEPDVQKLVVKKGIFEELKSTILYLEIKR